jgi:hypothetical protein
MNSPSGRREAQAAIIWNRSCAPAERSVKGFSRLRRREKRAIDRLSVAAFRSLFQIMAARGLGGCFQRASAIQVANPMR